MFLLFFCFVLFSVFFLVGGCCSGSCQSLAGASVGPSFLFFSPTPIFHFFSFVCVFQNGATEAPPPPPPGASDAAKFFFLMDGGGGGGGGGGHFSFGVQISFKKKIQNVSQKKSVRRPSVPTTSLSLSLCLLPSFTGFSTSFSFSIRAALMARYEISRRRFGQNDPTKYSMAI